MTGRFKAAALAAGIALAALSGGLASQAYAQSTSAAAAKPMADAPYWNASLPTDQRVADLLARMTLEEKIAQITALWDNKTEVQRADYTFDPAKASQTHPAGVGTISRPSDKHGPASPSPAPTSPLPLSANARCASSSSRRSSKW